MKQDQILFLLKYAKKGVLSSMKNMDPIESEELKHKYIKIKNDLLDSTPSNKSDINASKKNNDKASVVKKWFSGIGDRQKKYKETHKDSLI